MRGAGLAAALIAACLPAACGGDAAIDRAASWGPTGSAAHIAFADCDDQVDDRMRLHGFPRRPSLGTPQHRYRIAYMDKCMRDKGFEPD